MFGQQHHILLRISTIFTLYIRKLSACHALKIKRTQIIFKQETHSNITSTLTIHKQTSLNFDDKKYIILAQMYSISITVHNFYCNCLSDVLDRNYYWKCGMISWPKLISWAFCHRLPANSCAADFYAYNLKISATFYKNRLCIVG